MSDRDPARLPATLSRVDPPSVAPPLPFPDRRRTFRRASDRLAHEETRLLARALDVLAGDEPAEARMAGLLDLLADTVGAIRAAVVSDRPARRVAVAVHDDAEHEAARALAAWLDAAAPRSRAQRAAAGSAPVALVHRPRAGRRPAGGRSAGEGLRYALLPVPTAGEVALGFEFASEPPPGLLEERLPPTMARHAAVALALVSDAAARERELLELRAGESERERFVSTVAHELRTPLTGLAGYLDLILDGRVGDPAVEREFLERGRTIVGSMAALVGDLLELSRLEAGSIALEADPFSLAEAIGAVAHGLMPIALERMVELRVDAPPRLRAAVGDRRRVEQILTNLAANALKFGADGGRVELVGRFDGGVAVAVVRDDGPGIDATDRGRIFERFYRTAGHERVTGTGLGLPIARDLARRMGGDLDVASRSGAGSAFVLVLPGPAGAGAGAVTATMRRALDEEDRRLEREAILRAGAGDRRPADRATLRLEGGLSTNPPPIPQLVDNPVDADRSRPVASGLRTGAQAG